MSREKLATQIEADLLEQMRALARRDGRALEALIDEAVADYVDRRRREPVRQHVMEAYEGSHERYAEVYRKLAG